MFAHVNGSLVKQIEQLHLCDENEALDISSISLIRWFKGCKNLSIAIYQDDDFFDGVGQDQYSQFEHVSIEIDHLIDEILNQIE